MAYLYFNNNTKLIIVHAEIIHTDDVKSVECANKSYLSIAQFEESG